VAVPLVIANRQPVPEEKRMGVTVIVLDAWNLGNTDNFVYARARAV
jgi:hypothetical protein